MCSRKVRIALKGDVKVFKGVATEGTLDNIRPEDG